MARSFNAAGYISIPNAAPLSTITAAISVSAWVSHTTLAGQQRIVAKWDGSTTWHLELFQSNWSLFVHNGTTQTGAGTPAVSGWHHLCGTFDGSNIRFYLDGSLKQTTALSGSISTNTHAVNIGANEFNTPQLKGSAQEIAIWSRVLTAAEIGALAAGVRAYRLPASLAAYWPLDGLSSPEPDMSGNRNNGTINSTVGFATGAPLTLFTPKPPAAFYLGVTHTATLAATESGIATMARVRGHLLAISEGSAVALIRSIGKILALSEGSPVTLGKSIGKLSNVVEGSSPALLKSRSKSLSAAETSATALTAFRSKLLSVAQPSAGAMLRSIGLNRNVIEGSAALVTKGMRKSISTVNGTTAAMSRSTAKILPFWSLTTPAITRTVGKGFAVAQSTIPSLARRVGKNLNLAGSSISAMIPAALHPLRLAAVGPASWRLVATAQHQRVLAAASSTIAVLGRLKGVILIAAGGSSVARLVASRFVVLGASVQAIASLGARFLRYVLGRFIIGTGVVRDWTLTSVARGWVLGPVMRKWRIGRTK